MLNEKMTDADKLRERIGEFADRRGDHLKDLWPVEEIMYRLAPLPPSYDVNRNQAPFFNEFTYTEMLGGFLISPQSSEVATRMAVAGMNDPESDPKRVLNFLQDRFDKKQTLDKYALHAPIDPQVREVAFLPGCNIFTNVVSREVFSRLMHENPNVFIKPHPMTYDPLIRDLGIEFGYHRILDREASGWRYLDQASKVYCCASTEMGIMGALLGKEVGNIGNFYTEATAVYYPFYHLAKSGDFKQNLIKSLGSPLSGFFIPSDTDLEGKMQRYFEKVMEIREFFKPIAYEMSGVEWANAKHAIWRRYSSQPTK